MANYGGGVLVAVKYIPAAPTQPRWCVYFKDPRGGGFGDPIKVHAASREEAIDHIEVRRRLDWYNKNSVVGKITVSGATRC